MIKANNFDRQYAELKPELDKVISRVLESGWYVLGKELEAFEQEFAEYCGRKYCVGVGSGTDALILSLMCAGIGAGDEVITSSLTAYPTITAIQAVGAIPVAVDVNRSSGLISVEEIKKVIRWPPFVFSYLR